jgi:thiol-disulfide isomerase/thioredoxin
MHFWERGVFMRNFFVIALFLFILGCSSTTCCSLAQTEKNTPSQVLSAQRVTFVRPQDKAALDYLGLQGDAKTFTISEVNAEVVVVEVFNWDCHFCQREAPRMVELYQMLAQKGLGDRIKIMGIGATDTDLEIRQYQKSFNIPFPLIADPDYKSYGLVGRLEIPSISVFKRDAQGVWSLVFSKSREQRAAEAILKDILSSTGL